MDLIKIRVKKEPAIKSDWYEEDKKRIQEAFKSAGYYVTLEQAEELWEMYSESFCAGWLVLPDIDADIITALNPLFEEDWEERYYDEEAKEWKVTK